MTTTACRDCGKPIEAQKILGTVLAFPYCAECADTVQRRFEQEQEMERQRKLENIRRNYHQYALEAGVPPRLVPADFDTMDRNNDNRKAISAALTFARESTPGFLLLYGPVGTGKSWIASAMVRERICSGMPANFIDAGEMLQEIWDAKEPKRNYDDHLYRFAKFLVIDELAMDTTTQWLKEKMCETWEDIIGWRYNHCLPTVITSNHEPNDIAVKIGARVMDRIGDSRLTILVSGNSRRTGAK